MLPALNVCKAIVLRKIYFNRKIFISFFHLCTFSHGSCVQSTNVFENSKINFPDVIRNMRWDAVQGYLGGTVCSYGLLIYEKSLLIYLYGEIFAKEWLCFAYVFYSLSSYVPAARIWCNFSDIICFCIVTYCTVWCPFLQAIEYIWGWRCKEIFENKTKHKLFFFAK